MNVNTGISLQTKRGHTSGNVSIPSSYKLEEVRRRCGVSLTTSDNRVRKVPNTADHRRVPLPLCDLLPSRGST